jgi:ABC-type sugar transport system ATPase subunit
LFIPAYNLFINKFKHGEILEKSIQLNQESNVLMRVSRLMKSYGGLKAVDDVSFEIYTGEIFALVGDNGAGKSTLVKALSGATPQDSGSIEFDGKPVKLVTPRDADEIGIGCLYQGLGLVDALNVPENVFLGQEIQKQILGFIPQLDHVQMREKTIELLQQFGVDLPKVNDAVVNLSGGQRQTVAISRLLLKNVKLVIMDEPMAALGVDEGSRVLKLIENMKSKNISVIVISHNLEHVFKLANRIAVMKNGKLVNIVDTSSASRESVVKMITFGQDQKQ